MSYCDGRCIYLNQKKHICECKNERLTYMKQGNGLKLKKGDNFQSAHKIQCF